MYEIRGISFSFNTTKVVYVAEALGVKYTYREMDISKQEHKQADHLARHPLGKLPTLTHNGEHLFESGAICKYLASVERSDLYPTGDPMTRCKVDQWMDFFSVHLGRWLSTLLFERVFREKFGLGSKNEAAEKEALGFVEQQLKAVDGHLEGRKFLVGDQATIADIFAFAYIETTEMSQVSLDPYPNLKAWYERGKSAEPVQRAKSTTLKAAA